MNIARRCRSGRKQVVIATMPNFIEMASSIAVPQAKQGASWDEILRRMRRARAEKRIEP